MKYIIAILLPPLAVSLAGRRDELSLNIILCLCGYLPGQIHALFIVRKYMIKTLLGAFSEKKETEKRLFASVKSSHSN